ncbi:zinc finger protein [Saccharopolyspora sp. NPDC002376]
MSDIFQPQGLIAYWRPASGLRHGLEPDELPRSGQERDTLCGLSITVGSPTERDWLDPTCETCWNEARSRRDAASGGAR